MALQENPKFDLTGEATHAYSLLAMVAANHSDLALIGELPGCAIKDLIGEMHAWKSRPTVFGMSDRIQQCAPKSDRSDWLLESLRIYEKRSRKSKG